MLVTRSSLSLALLLAGCSSANLPASLVCEGAVRRASSDAELASALMAAQPGDCVLLAAGTYTGPITIATRALTLAADVGAIATVQSARDGVRVEAANVVLYGFEITRAARHGVVLLREGARVERLKIVDAGAAGVMIKCEDSGCMQRSALTDVEIVGAAYGLYVDGSAASVTGGRIGESRSDQLGGGAGAYAVRGADLEITGTRIDHNVYGLVADGAATQVRTTDAIVEANSDLGIWGQGLRGTAGAPALAISGAAGRISDNGITGVGAFDSAGVRVDGGEISRTVEKDVLIDLINLVRIGDGLGVLAGSREIEVSDARLVDNGRAQGLIDDAGANIRFTATNTISGGRHRVVVQNSTVAVAVPASQRSTPAMALPVRMMAFPVPALTAAP